MGAVAADQTYVTKALMDCNYLQGSKANATRRTCPFCIASSPPPGAASYSLWIGSGIRNRETDFGMRLIARKRARHSICGSRVSSCQFIVGCRREIEKPISMCRLTIPTPGDMIWGSPGPCRRQAESQTQIGPDYRKIRNLRNNYSRSPAAGDDDLHRHRKLSTTMAAPPKPWDRSTIARKNT
jgi:hypothetical protein